MTHPCQIDHSFGAYLRFRDMMVSVIDETRYPMAWLDRRVLDGTALAWATDKAAVVVEVRPYPSGAEDVHALVAAGDLDEIVSVLTPSIETWARAHGCIGATVESREGWERALRDSGYSRYQTVLRKEL